MTEKYPKRIIDEDELLKDGELICSFVIPTNCATKKTSQSIIYVRGKPMIISSKRYIEYEKFCKPFCLAVRKDLGKQPIDFGVSIKIKVYRSSWIRIDQTGILQSFGDIFQKWDILADDRWINWISDTNDHWWGGLDKENPRTEIFIYRCKHPYEDYREESEKEEERLFNKRGGPRKESKKKTLTTKKNNRKRRKRK